MGLTIHYSGRFNPTASLSEMIEEIKDICEVQKWPYEIFNRDFPAIPFPDDYNEDIYGICFIPPKSEPVCFEFLSNGRMSGEHLLHFWGKSENEAEKPLLYGLFTKTQFAGIQVHALIVEIFRYISKKYLLDFQMTDEGQYWETSDMEILKERFRVYEGLLDNFSLGLQTIPVKEDENIEEYLLRVMENVQKLKKEK